MDISDTWLEHMLRDLIPPAYLTLLETHVLHPHSPFQLLKRRLYALLARAVNAAYPLLMPLATRLTAYLHSSPDVVFFACVLSLLYLLFVALAWLRRVMMFWMRMAVKLAVLAVGAAVFAVAWQRGLEQSARDVFAVAARVAGWAEVVRVVWVREYERYVEQERVQRGS